MTEAEWRVSTDPLKMLTSQRAISSKRKLRLFAVACCRRIWPLLSDIRSQRAVEMAERYSDGDLAWAQVEQIEEAADLAVRESPGEAAAARAAAATLAAWAPPIWGACQAAQWAAQALESHRRDESRFQANLLRCIFGNPVRRSSVIPATVLAWNDGTVRRIAECIYEERAFDRLPILADALLDAGCDNEELIAHCRSAGPHVRGCWALDLILGKS